MKVAGYIRASSNKEKQKESPENQKEIIQNFIKENEYDLHSHYIDVQTGTTDRRDGLKQMIEDAENKQFDVIVAKELSRLGRNVELLYKLIRMTINQGIRVITLDGKVDTNDPAKQAMFGLYAWIYESESQRIGDRIKSVFHVKQKQGLYLGSRPPYGYQLVNRKLVIKEDEASIVADIFNKYLSGMNRCTIARYLNEKGIATHYQGSSKVKTYWSQNVVRGMLENPSYVGDMVQNKRTSISVTMKKFKVNEKKDWIVVPNVHEPIVTREVYEHVNKILESEVKKGRGKLKATTHLFTNYVYCADCGKSMWHHQRGGRRARYICGSYGKHGNIACTIHSILEDKLSEMVLEDMRTRSQQLDSSSYEAELEKKTATARKKTLARLKWLESQIQKQMILKQNALEKFICDAISKEAYDSFIEKLQEKINQLEQEKAELTKNKQPASEIDRKNLKKKLDGFLKLNELTREMLSWFVERIEITETKEVRVKYKYKELEGIFTT